MKWRVVLSRSAEKELAKISHDTQLRIGRAIRTLETDPIPASSKRLKGREEFRLRVGDYRLLYIIDYPGKTIVATAIGHRRDVYR